MSTRKREVVFTAHVLNRLFPSESEQGVTALQQLPAKDSNSSKKSLTTKRPSNHAKVYTAELPPDGLPETQDISSVRPSPSSESDSSSETEDENALPRKRRRKRKCKKKALQVNVETLTSSSRNAVIQDDPSLPNGTNRESQTQKLELGDSEMQSSPLEAAAQTLTKNQRKKLRKKRAKMGKPSHQRMHRATEFICDDGCEEAESNGDDEFEGIACEVKDFMESVWRVYCCDGTKKMDVPCQTEPFQAMIGQLCNNQLQRETLTHLNDIKKLLVLQDFTRARLKLTELREKSMNSSKSENASIFSTLAEYWMKDIHTATLR